MLWMSIMKVLSHQEMIRKGPWKSQGVSDDGKPSDRHGNKNGRVASWTGGVVDGRLVKSSRQIDGALVNLSGISALLGLRGTSHTT